MSSAPFPMFPNLELSASYYSERTRERGRGRPWPCYNTQCDRGDRARKCDTTPTFEKNPEQKENAFLTIRKNFPWNKTAPQFAHGNKCQSKLFRPVHQILHSDLTILRENFQHTV
ncbi:hypothetical protein RRG08_027932 [Elysia crispata]|uniref:Uncharacterized protein n=1 Tax=Elysia crispata TaxID=231223 RepID=A0AAE1CUC1_9GAST|nr:hypothetical protein RRG08_027932 [Elysia crispata]